MRRFVILAFVVITTSLTGQVEHAPTVAQCQADQRLWLAQAEDNVGTNKDGDTLPPSYNTLSEWRREMQNCVDVDPENRRSYSNTESELVVVLKRRLGDFIERHGMWSKFLEEDAAGKR